VKHAFLEDDVKSPVAMTSKDNDVHVQVSFIDDHLVRVTVADNGAGFPESLDYQRADTLGLKLVDALVRQLEGQLEMHSNDGTKVSFSFEVSQEEARN
jgi:two-component sensor histidine kinase